MIAFGCSITTRETYARCAEPGIRRAAEPDSVVIANAAAGSIFRSYNRILDEAAALDDLEALVLLHQDAEIDDPAFTRKLRAALADPAVGVVGCVGAVDVRSIAWWEGSVTWASFTHRYPEYGGGEIEAFAWRDEDRPGYARLGEVDTVDGFVLALSPWAVQHVRFDEDLGTQLHGYDLDFCLQVREAGRTIRTADFKVIHHHSLALVSDSETWIQAHMRIAEKWEGRMPGIGRNNWGAAQEDWKQRARRAEAEAGAAQLERTSEVMAAQARERQARREADDLLGSTSWRATRPLRELGLWARAQRQRSRDH